MTTQEKLDLFEACLKEWARKDDNDTTDSEAAK